MPPLLGLNVGCAWSDAAQSGAIKVSARARRATKDIRWVPCSSEDRDQSALPSPMKNPAAPPERPPDSRSDTSVPQRQLTIRARAGRRIAAGDRDTVLTRCGSADGRPGRLRYSRRRQETPFVNIVDKSNAISATAAGDLDRFRLRRFIEELPGRRTRDPQRPIDLADVAQALEGNPQRGAVQRRRPRAAGTGRQRHRQPRAASPAPSASSRTSCCAKSSGGCATSPRSSRSRAPRRRRSRSC